IPDALASLVRWMPSSTCSRRMFHFFDPSMSSLLDHLASGRAPLVAVERRPRPPHETRSLLSSTPLRPFFGSDRELAIHDLRVHGRPPELRALSPGRGDSGV